MSRSPARRRGVPRRPLAAALLSALALTTAAVPAEAQSVAAAATAYTPVPPHNPYAGPDGTATMHGDTGSSDTTLLAGPGTGTLSSERLALASACPTVLVGSDGYPVILCTPIFGQVPTVHLLDPDDGSSLATLKLTKGSLLGGVYAYLDNKDRLVVADGSRNLLRVAHSKNADGDWKLAIDQSLSLASVIPEGDAVTGLSPDWQGRVWFATGNGVVGTADDRTGTVRALTLPAGERVANSISTAPQGTAVTTTHATYLLTAGADGTPKISWRQAYDRGQARKPGLLSWGSGSTPTFFGPTTGTDYVGIVDNADTTVRLKVYRTSTGAEVCSVPVLRAAGGPGSENSPVGAGSSVFVAGTYGYPYPAVPDGAGDSVPASADFAGGLTRVDVRADGTGCTEVWDNTLRSAAVPKLSTADGTLHTVVRDPLIPGTKGTSLLDPYRYVQIDPETGTVKRSKQVGIGSLFDTLQMAGTIAPDGTYLQGTVTGVLRITAG
ncbi:hypothetical protein [Streptomyces poonensis]|uniref:Secreted protein n=1 Tax=Streptomyces poonensis TaxID=68255 RepID=A0A918UCA8_9ACTN|nr:hypothetical protein [Streptomyces poonensis]GGY90933.1 hypothetical protein GCM10010365_06670 [Streptomyces poonensis]GLJ87896.1 hypothetical protein GCM10017589_04960 [Streptomyces poonensis]